MLPYFRSAGWHDYARFAAFYVYHMKGHDPVMMKTLQYGAFVRHIPGIYNSTLTDMFVEKTNIHAAVAWTDRGYRGGYRLPSYDKVGPWLCRQRGGIAECSILSNIELNCG